ncbi:MAG: tRNA (guanosine(37)-N1)-methyltransferase TrmD [Acidobacteria bacterium]|nr:tRNA (guanosine(37)-N1)-methyltransferase TrmD [Acidobacteriota bacterium]
MNVDVITLFPEWFDWLRRPRHLANASEVSGLGIRCFNPREHTPLGQGQVDDAPYGGGPGMVLRVDVMAAAMEAIYGMPAEQVRDTRRVVVLSPRGRPFDDAVARELAALPDLTLLCGRYEGFDERVHEHLANDCISLGPFVLAGGEVAAMAIIDAMARRLPGALGNDESLDRESFSPGMEGQVEHPHYTRPAEFRGWGVPPVLLSGDHGAIEEWRQSQVRPAPGAGSVLFSPPLSSQEDTPA